MHKVFVVVVTYNGAQWLQKCIGGLRNSTIEVTPVVVDNNSNDNTVALLEKNYPEVILIQNNNNLGFGRANNVGIEYAMAAGADYIFLLNQDAFVFPDTIEKLIEVSRENPQYYILSPLHLEGSGTKLDHNFSRWAASGSSEPELIDLNYCNKLAEDIFPVKFVNAALWLLPRKAIETVGGFDPLFFHYGEDVDYANRVNYHGFKIGICPKAVGIHDRPQPSDLLVKKQDRQKLFKRETGYFITLKNINRNFFYCFLQFLNKFSKNLSQHLRKIDISSFFLDIKTAFVTFIYLPQVYKHRMISKSKRAFMNVSKSRPFAKAKNTSAITFLLTMLSPSIFNERANDLFVSYTLIIF